MKLRLGIALKLQALTVAATLLPAAAACVLPGASHRMNSSHFTFPNSNVYDVGTVTGKASSLCGILFITFGAPDNKLMRKALGRALDQRSEASMLIDMTTSSRTFMVPGLFSVCQVMVVGNAARVEIGEQDIGQHQAPAAAQPAPAPAPTPTPAAEPAPAAKPTPTATPTPNKPPPSAGSTPAAREGADNPACQRCPNMCSALEQQCAQSGSEACKKHARCICRCQQRAGGCGKPPAALDKCVGD